MLNSISSLKSTTVFAVLRISIFDRGNLDSITATFCMRFQTETSCVAPSLQRRTFTEDAHSSHPEDRLQMTDFSRSNLLYQQFRWLYKCADAQKTTPEPSRPQQATSDTNATTRFCPSPSSGQLAQAAPRASAQCRGSGAWVGRRRKWAQRYGS
mgnify:CR=1 FL=1